MRPIEPATPGKGGVAPEKRRCKKPATAVAVLNSLVPRFGPRRGPEKSNCAPNMFTHVYQAALLKTELFEIKGKLGGDDGARTRDLRRDRPAF
jgi:hypothetical protein